MRLERLHPESGALTPEQAVSGLGLADLAPAERPYLALNMVATLDGKATVDGGTRAMSSEVDRELFHGLRTQVDAVLVGAGTVRAERYARIVKNDELRERRRREGLAPDPLTCVVSARLELPGDLPLLQDPDSRVLVATTARSELRDARAMVHYLRFEGAAVDLARLLGRLHSELGVRSVLCEGGPTLNAGLVRAGLVDELFLTLSSQLVGGSGLPTIVDGEGLPRPIGLELGWLARAGDELFGRYRVRR